jgi:putative membrane protein
MIIETVALMWLAAMISVPVVAGRGERFRSVAISSGVVAQVALIIVTLFLQWELSRAFRAVLLVPVLGWTAEFIGSRTGIPFGKYHYTPVLQPQIHRVPVVIPFAWLMMLPPAWAVAQWIAPGAHPVVNAVIAGAAFTAWDVYLDPHLVRWRFWEWDEPGVYEGIPLKNFFGWFLWASVITFLVGPPSLPLFPLVPVYILTWLFQFGGHIVFWRLRVSGIAGFLAMGAFILPVIIRLLLGA